MHRKMFILGVTCALVGVTLGSLFHPTHGPVDLAADELPAAARAAPVEATAFTPEELVNIAVYDNVNQSVVNITTKSVRSDLWYTDVVPMEGSGSGSVLDKEGHILTNFHVIEGAQQVQVSLANGNRISRRTGRPGPFK